MRVYLLLLCVLMLFGIVSCASADSGLVGHWKLLGDCRDASGNANHGVNRGADLKGRDGASFDGAGAYIEVPDSKSLQLGTGDFSISAWVKCRPGKTNVVGDILNKYDQSARKGVNLHVNASASGYSGTSDVRNVQFGIDNAVEGSWADCGKPCATNPLISALVVYKGELYAATTDAAKPEDACHVYRYAGGQKWVDCGRVRPDTNTRSIYSMIVHKGSLYVGTGTWDWEQSPSSGLDHVYRYDGGTSWHDCGQFGTGRRVMSMASFGGKLYATDDAGDSWRYDGDSDWAFCGHVATFKILSTMIYRDRLYGGADSLIYRYNGTGAWDVVGEFPWADVNQVHTMGVYAGNLYAATWPLGRILRYDGDRNWAICGQLGISTDQYKINEINDLTTYNGKLYAGVIPKGEVWRYEGGSDWTMLKQLVHVPAYSPASYPTWSRVPSMAIFQGRLYLGTGSCQARTANADLTSEVGGVYAFEAGKGVSYDDDLGTEWKLVTAVRERSHLKLYIDGLPVATSPAFDGAKFNLSNGKPLLIGFGAENYFNGNMRDVRLYKRGLKESEVKALYAKTKSPRSAPAPADAGVQIIVNPGRFDSIESAASGEDKVNFWDADFTDDDASTECFAATELRDFLSSCPGMEGKPIHLKWTTELPKSGYVFVLGNRKSNPLVGCLDTADKTRSAVTTPESYSIRVVPQGKRTICVIEGKGRVGTLYGAYDYLQRIGFRFFGMGDMGTVRPKDTVELIRSLDVTENPAFATRGFFAWQARGNKDFFVWMARNRLTFWTSEEKTIPLLKKLGMRLAVGSHDIQTNFLDPKSEYPYNYAAFKDDKSKPADPYQPSAEYAGDANKDGKLSYFEAHPEWYGLRDGKRSDKIQGLRGDNYCTSNDDATAELAKNYVRGLIDGKWSKADVVNFWMEDGGRWCECDKCKALGTATDRLLLLIYKVNREVQAARKSGALKRDVHLTTLAYLETIAPPTHPLPPDFDYENCSVTFYPNGRCYVHDLADPSCTEFNKSYYDNYMRWMTGEDRLYRGTMFIGEYYNVSVYWAMPALYTRVMSADIPMFYQTGTRHFQYMHTPTHIWGTWTLNQYLMGRLLWNPQVDVKAVLGDYFARYYPTTAQHTRAFYEHLEHATCNINCLKAGGDVGVYEHLHYETYHPDKNDGPDLDEIRESIGLARKEIDQSLLECSDPAEKLRLLEDERRFAYGEATVAFRYHMTRINRFEQRHEDRLARNEFGYLEREAVALQQFGRDMVETYLIEGDADGLIASRGADRYKALKAKYGSAPR